MKRAYSLNRGVVIAAEDITYRDCCDDRITCEICGLRVFKVERDAENRVIHYMSHYRKNEHTKKCAARVAENIKSEKSAASSKSQNHGQTIADRVEALGRTLMQQFPEVGRYSNGIGVRLLKEARKGNKAPETVMELWNSLYAMLFQLVARREGAQLEVRDLITPDIDRDWPQWDQCCSEQMLQKMRKNPPRKIKSGFVTDMTRLLCQADSRETLYVLARHAFSDIVINGLTWSDPRADKLHAVMTDISKTKKRTSRNKEHEALVPIGAMMPELVPTGKWGDYSNIAVIARMQDILCEIDKDLPVPEKGSPQPVKPRAITASEEVYFKVEQS